MSAAQIQKNHPDDKPTDHDHQHAFDPEPVRVLPPDEPRTPLWVPLLGLALFVIAGTWVLLFSGGSGPEGQGPDKQSAAKTTPPSELAVQPVAPPPQMRLPTPGATPSSPSVQRLSPEQAKALQERLEQMRNRGVTAQPPPGQPQPPAPGR